MQERPKKYIRVAAVDQHVACGQVTVNKSALGQVGHPTGNVVDDGQLAVQREGLFFLLYIYIYIKEHIEKVSGCGGYSVRELYADTANYC